jgi:hypothetical protein
MCALSGCTDSRLSQALKPEHCQRGRAKLTNHKNPKEEKTKTSFNMKKEKKN